jgi:deazaflavin-dependent oxidoreductase (nitroreductase family)
VSAGIVSFADANPAQRALRRLVASRCGSWVAVRALHRIDGPVFRATRGRHTVSSLVSGLPVVFLTTRGARSGRPRTVPLLGLPTEDGVAVIASNFGQGHHPAWYHNLRAHPRAAITVDGTRHEVTARVAEGEERERLRAHPEAEIAVDGRRERVRAVPVEGERRERIWRAGLEMYPGWTQYERRAQGRRIVVFVLEPLQSAQ